MDELEQSNVIPFPAAPIEAPPICVPLDSVESAGKAAVQLEYVGRMLQVVLAKASIYGEAAALAAAAQIIEGLVRSLDNLRTNIQIDPAFATTVLAQVTQYVHAEAGEEAARAVAAPLAAGLAYLLNSENREPDKPAA
jgi:predicted glycoside hydrolase/deacetylase ChbG (UPF0249 family)